MSEAKRRGPKPSKTARQVGVPLTPDQIRDLDGDRAKLDKSRGGALREIWLFARSKGGVDAAQQRAAQAGATAADLRSALQPLVDGMRSLDGAWRSRANQRQAIGTQSNQIAKLSNFVRSTGQLDLADRIDAALAGIDRRLAEQQANEKADDQLRHDVRLALDELKKRLCLT